MLGAVQFENGYTPRVFHLSSWNMSMCMDKIGLESLSLRVEVARCKPDSEVMRLCQRSSLLHSTDRGAEACLTSAS